VRILRPPIEGKLARGASGADVGDQIHVELLSVDVERGFIDFGRWSSGASGGAAHGSPGQGGR
jgi:exoribonuclease-2